MIWQFAHNTGEAHIETSETAGVVPFIAANIFPLALLVLIWIIMTYGFKTKPSTRLMVTMAYLLIVGVTMFMVAPIASIVALIAGFGLALGTMFFQVKR